MTWRRDDKYTVSLLHFSGADASTTISDEVLGKTWTAGGNAQIDTAQSVFNGSSLLLDGTGDYAETADHVDFELGSGDFTLDARIRPNALPANNSYMAIVAKGWDVAGQYGYFFALAQESLTRKLVFFYSTTGANALSIGVNWTPSTGTWYHVALARSGTTARFFVDGSQVGTDQTLNATIYNGTGTLRIGRSATQYDFNGWIDELRFSKGVARWVSGFTVPAKAYQPAGVIAHIR